MLLFGAAFVRWAEWMLPAEDPDVGLYLHVAYAWLHGHLPYLVAWEYKPPGLFALYAFALRVCGQPALAVQSLATAATWTTALAVWRLAPLVDANGGERSGKLAAAFAVLLSTENEGYLGDAEVLVSPFIAWALVVALRRRSSTAGSVCCGLLCAGALQMKLTALPLLLPVAFALGVRARYPVGALATALAATLSPFAFEAAIYARAGHFDALWDANVGATVRRLRGLHSGIVMENVDWVWRQGRIMAPALQLAVASAFVRRRSAAWAASWGWLAASLVAVGAVGELYNRQFVLVQAPVALLGGVGLGVVLQRLSRRAATAVAAVVLVATFALHDYWKTEQAAVRAQHWVILGKRTWREPEYPQLLRMLRRCRVRSSLYIVQLTPLLYDTLGIAAPTRFADSDDVFETRMHAMIGLPGTSALERIFARRPRYVLVGGDLTRSRFDRRAVALLYLELRRRYRAIAHTGYAVLYERTPPRAPGRTIAPFTDPASS